MFRVPVEAFVWTTSGPWRAGDLSPSAKLVLVGPDGRPATSSVSAISSPAERQVLTLLTTAGEIHLEACSAISTRGARVFAATAATEAIAGRSPRIELAHPRDLPPVPSDGDLSTATRRSLALVDPPVIRVPRGLGMDDRLRDLLRAAGVDHRDATDERWTAMAFDSGCLEQSVGPVGPTEAIVLQAVTAWARLASDVTVCRTTMAQAKLRTRLVAALAAAGTPAVVGWTPAYGPVEARVTAGLSDAFATARGATAGAMACVDICSEDPGSVITDRAIVAARLETGD